MKRKELQASDGGFVKLVPLGPAPEGSILARFQLRSITLGASI